MKVLVSGASGLVGTALGRSLEKGGHEVWRLVRRPAQKNEITWAPDRGVLEPSAVLGFDGVVHLAGENIAAGRWSAARKAAIRTSRIQGTELIARTLAGLPRPPATLVVASAIGYFGDRGDETLSETAAPGTGFLPEVCVAWEEAASAAKTAGIRTVHLRFGIILSKEGGALKKMLPPFKLGAGGRLGSGKQWMSWLSLDDAVGQIEFALCTNSVRGAVNAVTGAVTNQEFTKTLGRVLKRPTIFPLPAPMARIALGEMADALLLASTRVDPKVLRDQGYRPRHPELESALRDLLRR